MSYLKERMGRVLYTWRQSWESKGRLETSIRADMRMGKGSFHGRAKEELTTSVVLPLAQPLATPSAICSAAAPRPSKPPSRPSKRTTSRCRTTVAVRSRALRSAWMSMAGICRYATGILTSWYVSAVHLLSIRLGRDGMLTPCRKRASRLRASTKPLGCSAARSNDVYWTRVSKMVEKHVKGGY